MGFTRLDTVGLASHRCNENYDAVCQGRAPPLLTKSVMQTGSTPHRMTMVGYGLRSSRGLDGLPLAWGAKAHASTCYRDPFFLQAAEGQGVCACPDWYSGFLFSWEVTKSQK
jgi:hypothetical protein